MKEKSLLFKAVSCITGLKELHMQNWEELVGVDAAFCTDPLQRMPEIQVFVPRVKKDSPEFPPNLIFFSTEVS